MKRPESELKFCFFLQLPLYTVLIKNFYRHLLQLTRAGQVYVCCYYLLAITHLFLLEARSSRSIGQNYYERGKLNLLCTQI